MISPIRTVFRGLINGAGAPNELGTLTHDRRLKKDGSRRAVVALHGHGGTGWTGVADVFEDPVMRAVVQAGLPVLTVDAGGGVNWSGDAALSRLDEAVDWLAAQGFAAPPILLGFSMGSMLAANYVARHPAKVRAAALVWPATDVTWFYNAYKAEIDAVFANAAARDAHDPLKQAQANAFAGHPLIRGYYSTNDATVNAASWVAFRDALGGLGPTVEEVSMGAIGHGDPTLAPAADIAAWCALHS